MRGLLSYFRHSVALRLGITILFFVLLVLSVSLGYLYIRSRQLVKTEVFERALKELEKTDLQMTDYLNEAEAATKDIEWQVMRHLQPDSLLSFSHRVVALNPDINGCSITMEPDFFPPSIGRFSAYSIRRNDSIITVREADYNYHEKIWYKKPKTMGKACWVDPYNDYTEGTLYNEDMIASYSKPLYDKEGHMIGVISTDLSLNWISSVLNRERPYPNSYYIMLGHDGRYFVHPDHDLIVNKTIYEGIDAKEHSDIIVLGHEMQSGERDYMEVNFDGEPCYVFYQPVEETGWSLALVCPENDIMGGYNRLGAIILVIMIVGLCIILIFWMRFMRHFISPLTQLVKQSHDIATGHFNESMPKTERRDLVGQLQNSFAAMQESLAEHIAQLQQVHDDTEKRNQQLLRANQLAQESLQGKRQFIQDVSHQIRTPLNIIQGFFMILGDASHEVPADQQKEMTDTM
jgi:HAMP domain-containing protein